MASFSFTILNATSASRACRGRLGVIIVLVVESRPRLDGLLRRSNLISAVPLVSSEVFCSLSWADCILLHPKIITKKNYTQGACASDSLSSQT